MEEMRVPTRSEAEKRAQAAYYRSVRRFQVTLNPNNKEDREIIAFLDGTSKKGTATAATVKTALRRYMKMLEALGSVN